MESNKKFFYSVGIFSITLLIWMIFPIDVQASLNCGDPGVVCRQGTLAGDETWTSENIYVITDSDLIIPIGVTLTIEEGTIIKITDNWLELIVDGSLIINGQSDNRVYITSIHDDLGGDTNHDTTSPSAGNWGSVYFRGGSSGTLNFVEMHYGGDDDNSKGGLLYTDSETNVIVSNGVFKNSEYCAINSDPRSEPTLNNMSWQDFTGSTFNGLCMRSLGINNNATWDETEVAYVLLDDVTVTSGYTLTLGSGVVVKPRANWVDLFIDGTLFTIADEGNPIYITSIKDDNVGGNTDNQAATPDNGNWETITFRSGSNGTLSHIIIQYGDYGINATNATVSLSNVILRHNTYGLRNSGSSVNVGINYSEIYGNSTYGVYNDVSGIWLDATNNWWGSVSGPYDPITGVDGDYNDSGKGDKVSDYVLYRPWSFGNIYQLFLPFLLRIK